MERIKWLQNVTWGKKEQGHERIREKPQVGTLWIKQKWWVR